MILITGSTGFIGINLLVKLSKNKVVALYRSEEKKKDAQKFLETTDSCNENIIWKKSNTNNVASLEDCFKDITHVYHCSGLISFSVSDKEKLNNNNTESTKNIVNLCIDKKIQKLVYISSISALGNEINNRKINESSNYEYTKHVTPYSFSKYNSEIEVWRGIEEGLKAVIINPGVVLGESIKNDAPEVKLRKTIKKYPFCFFTRGGSGFVNINDVIKLSIKLMESPIYNERFILVAKNYSYLSIMKKLMKKLKINKVLIPVEKQFIYCLYYLDFIFSLIGIKNRYMSIGLIYSLIDKKKYDGSKIIKYFPEFNYSKLF